MAEVKVLITGYAIWLEALKQKACGSITLVRGRHNVIVDTGNVGDGVRIIKLLAKEGLKPEDIHYVVNTHGDIDHVGNNNLFTRATFIASHDIVRDQDIFTFFEEKYEIEPDICIISTPGHSIEDVSVLVKIKNGLVAITGDLFESELDIKDESWKVFSKYPERQVKSRLEILKIADFIVPGHGKIFKVKRSS
jgi:glyoxylase-like metal-dependent hydrolase (beta-lactamase superfamily II)